MNHDINIIRVTNLTLNIPVMTEEPINTPARKYVNSLTRSSERLHASNIILQREKEKLKQVVTTRKTRLSDKKSIDEKRNNHDGYTH